MSRSDLVLVAGLLLAGCGGSSAPAWLRPVPDAEAVGVYHTVQPGESLIAICRAYRVELQEVAEVNGIEDPDRIAAGQQVFLPDAVAPRGGVSTAMPGGSAAPPRAGTAGTEVKRTAGRFIWPVDGVLTSRFGIRGGRRHDGIDIGAPEGTPIRAAADGTVLYVGEQGGYGRLVILRHAEDFITVYAHNRKNRVAEGQRVRQGQVIAEVGQTGRATGPHLHFEIRQATKPRNPLFFLPKPD